MRTIRVSAAVIGDAAGRIYATQRGYGPWKGWWEFPGGKIEAGETPEEAVQREIAEELETQIEIERLLRVVEYDYPEFHLSMHCYRCQLSGPAPRLKEHEAACWLAPNELGSVRWLPADLELIEQLSTPPNSASTL